MRCAPAAVRHGALQRQRRPDGSAIFERRQQRWIAQVRLEMTTARLRPIWRSWQIPQTRHAYQRAVDIPERKGRVGRAIEPVDAVPLVSIVALDAFQNAQWGVVAKRAQQGVADRWPGAQVSATPDAAW
jgi:hypothetical protein